MSARKPAVSRKDVTALHRQIDQLALLVPEGIASIRRVVDGLIRHEMSERMHRRVGKNRAALWWVP